MHSEESEQNNNCSVYVTLYVSVHCASIKYAKTMDDIFAALLLAQEHDTYINA